MPKHQQLCGGSATPLCNDQTYQGENNWCMMEPRFYLMLTEILLSPHNLKLFLLFIRDVVQTTQDTRDCHLVPRSLDNLPP